MKDIVREIVAGLVLMAATAGSLIMMFQMKFPVVQIYFQ